MLLEANGTRLWVDVRGSGPAMALLPGGPGLAGDYLEDVATLVEGATTVVIVEPRGCGRSDPADSYEVADLVSDIDAVRSSLAYEQWAIAGHSFGADLALAYALEHPDRIADIVAIAPTGLQDDRDWHRRYEEGLAAGLDQLPDPVPALNADMHAAALASWRRFIKQPDLLRRVADLPMPYVAIIGGDDIRPSWPAEQVATLMPRGRVELIEGAGHFPWWTHADQVARAMLTMRG